MITNIYFHLNLITILAQFIAKEIDTERFVKLYRPHRLEMAHVEFKTRQPDSRACSLSCFW